MIIFLNFAPIEYLGGAERKTYELFREVRKKEKVIVLTADYVLAGIYGKIVLNQPFEDRSNGELRFEKGERQFITFRSFIPFTKEWSEIRSLIQTARRIYIKCDLNELLLLLFFGGRTAYSRSVASVRSPWHYPSPASFMDRFHNAVYMSPLMKILLNRLQAIHVLTNRDKELFSQYFCIKDVVVIPNFSDRTGPIRVKGKRKNSFEIVCIGELIVRKGIDTILDVIRASPRKYVFHIIGDGPMRSDVLNVAYAYPGCIYHGYLRKEEVQKILTQSDVLFFPSRAEGFGGVILEALAHGLPIITSKEIQLYMPKHIEYVIPSRDPEKIVELLAQIENDIFTGRINRNQIKDYSRKHFDSKKILNQISHALLN